MRIAPVFAVVLLIGADASAQVAPSAPPPQTPPTTQQPPPPGTPEQPGAPQQPLLEVGLEPG